MLFAILGFYIGTTVLSYGIIDLCSRAVIDRIEREGYVIRGRISDSEALVSHLSNIIHNIIPVYNITAAVYSILKFDEIYEKLKQECLETGEIYMPFQEISNDDYKMNEFESNSIQKEITTRKNDVTPYKDALTFLDDQERELSNQNIDGGQKINVKVFKKSPSDSNVFYDVK